MASLENTYSFYTDLIYLKIKILKFNVLKSRHNHHVYKYREFLAKFQFLCLFLIFFELFDLQSLPLLTLGVMVFKTVETKLICVEFVEVIIQHAQIVKETSNLGLLITDHVVCYHILLQLVNMYL